jgi:alkylation response protein AidB-like acyl-CoA dehydrogenase
MFSASDDQRLFASTICRFLTAAWPPARLREVGGDDSGYDRDFWRQGAALGWASLTGAGGSASGELACPDAVALLVTAFEFGHHAAPGPLGPVSVVAGALARWGSPSHKEGPLEELISGDATAAWAVSEPAPHDAYGDIAVEARREGDSFVLSGVKAPVEWAGEADYVLVTASDAGRPVHLLLPPDLAGSTVTPMRSVDMTRRYAEVRFDGARVPVDGLVGAFADGGVILDWLADVRVLVQLGEMVGAMQWAFSSTLEWTKNRFTFGRPIASYQAIKHRMADMKTWLEASYAITEEAASAMEADSPDRSEMLDAAKSYVGRFGPELLQEAVQLHGGIGVTADHDLHLFLRRVADAASTFGTPREHAVRLGRAVEESLESR